MTNDKPSNAPRAWRGITRSHVARHLGVGITTVHRMRLRGDLNPTRDDSGVWRYDPADVVRAAALRDRAPVRIAGKTRVRTLRGKPRRWRFRSSIVAVASARW